MPELERKILSALCTSIREGIASLRIADFLRQKLADLGKEMRGVSGGIFLIDTGEQCTIGGVGEIFDDFRWTGKIVNYTGYGGEPATMYDKKNYHTAPCSIMNFDETYYRMPYDCRSRKIQG